MRWCLLLLLSLPVFAQVAAPADKKRAERPPGPVSLAAKPLRSGTVLREERQIDASDGEFHFISSKRTQDAITRYHQRLTLIRRVQGNAAEDVEVSDHSEDSVAYPAPPGPPENTQPGPLQTTRLRARQKLGRWSFELADKKPGEVQQRCLVELGVITDLLEASAWGIGTEPRKPGETWKPAFREVRGKARDMLVPGPYEITFTGLEDQKGETCARLTITGSLQLERPTYEGTLQVTFTGTHLRRLSDGLNLQSEVSGTLNFKGPVSIGGDAGTLTLKSSFKARRTQRILPR
ncbi:MAG: hypothetical protein V4662_24060 [Verrucomicrobiota bacterium]